jgi:large subunit ribosomal protein L16
MLIPKKVKYRKSHRGDQIRGAASRKITLSFGDFGLRAMEAGWVTSRQIEAARRAITGNLQRKGKLWIRIFPDKSVTVKGNEIRMGGGKGAVDHYVAPVRPGTIMFEVDGVSFEQARAALKLAAYKMPIKCLVVKKSDQ